MVMTRHDNRGSLGHIPFVFSSGHPAPSPADAAKAADKTAVLPFCQAATLLQGGLEVGYPQSQYILRDLTMTYPILRLKAKEERRIQQGHLWIYSNEIDVAKSPLTSFTPGDLVLLKDASDRSIGIAYVNPRTLLSARLLTRDPRATIDIHFFVSKLQRALALRERWYDKPYYRLVFGESDGLPGVVIDRFGDTVVLQVNTAGMDRLQDLLIAAINEVLSPETIILRADSSYRELEGLPLYQKCHQGDAKQLKLEENNTQFEVPLLTGQKTGWFYDHRDSRALLNLYCKDASVLDVFSYMGGWGIQAAVHGAKEVYAIDSSKPALESLVHNAALNKVADKVHVLAGDAEKTMQDLVTQNKHFDIVIIDPPALIKRKKDVAAGKKAYLRLNQLAASLVKPGGLLVSASCSMHLAREELFDIVAQAAAKTGRFISVFAEGHQAKCHPIHPAISETQYLKTLFCIVD